MTCIDRAPAVDVLLVIDDSASMGDMQDLLAQGLARFGDVYDDDGWTPIDFRIAVTTTSVSQPWCEGDADDGAFIDRSCRERLDDFTALASHESSALEIGDACREACAYETLPITPTSSDAEDAPRRRPWLEHVGQRRNFPADVPAAELLPCMGMVGVGGCAYESPLEAAYLALQRTLDPDDPAHGFLRHDAALFVLFVTDEVDCSVKPEHTDVFDPAGDRAHWPPDAAEATSAICWNAAMRCAGTPEDYACAEADEGPLQPLSRYRDLLRAIDLDKQHAQSTDAQRVFVHVLGGTAASRHALDEMVFVPSTDPTLATAFGIAPGCTWTRGEPGDFATAYPPGRLRVLADEFAEEVPLFSLCTEDYGQALACVPGQLDTTAPCVAGCAADIDPATEELEVDCTAIEHAADGSALVLPECVDGEPPAGEDSCVEWLTDLDMRHECVEAGTNIDHRVLRPLRRAAGTCVEVTCVASRRRAFDCPNMP